MVATVDRQELIVEAAGLVKVFRDFWGRPKARALNGIDLKIRRGQVFGLLGPNGSGKSTTVKLILGLLYPSRGSLRVLQKSPRNVEVKRRIGYLPEESYLYRYLTATETLDFFGALFGLPASERRRRGEQLLEMVGLANSSDRPVGEFSKGMARRIGLAQALINDPDLVILDEPTAGLDPIGCREVKDVIRLLASRGKTVILCSHLLADVEDICEEVVVLYGGKIRTQGELREILKVEDKTRIVTPRLPPEILDTFLRLAAQHVDQDQICVDHPSMNLESFFLDVVRRAKEASIDTAGAQAGGRIAEYLQGLDAADRHDLLSQQVLEALGQTPNAEAAAPEGRATDEETGEDAPVETRLDEARLAQLAEPAADETNQPATEAGRPGARTEAERQAETENSKRIKDVLRNKSSSL